MNGVSAQLADANGDGLKNLLAYAAGLSAWTQATSENGGLPVASKVSGYLAITFVRLKNAPGLTHTVEVSDNLTPWNSGSTYTTQVSVTSLDATREQITVRDKTPITGATRRMLRVRISATAP